MHSGWAWYFYLQGIRVHHSGDCICILFFADLGHYDRFCHGSYGIKGIHIRSWILASTSSLDRLLLQPGELIIATTVQRSGVNWDEQKDKQICHVHGEGRALHQVLREDERHIHGGESQLETTTTQARYFKSEYKYIRQRLENQHPQLGSEVFKFFKFILPSSEGDSTTTFKALAKHGRG
jgi:hypothetical protein